MPLLRLFEADDSQFVYKPSHRLILIVVSGMFLFLASLTWILAPGGAFEYFFPILIFGGAGIIGLIVGGLGKDVAVARLWGSR